MSASSSPEPGTTPDEYRQRALLFADLGRYDDAAEELAAGLTTAPADAALLTTLARVHLAADQPADALVAADAAVAAAPDQLDPLVVRGMALTDISRFTDAASVAAGILRRWPDNAYAQRTGAGLLGESRNGQEALNAAWHAVRIAPGEAEAHLVLAVVAARLRLFDLAQRAYAEALDLDEGIGEAQQDVGIVRFERRRWAQALDSLADGGTIEPGATEQNYPSPFPRPYPEPDAADTAALDEPTGAGSDGPHDGDDDQPRPAARRGFAARRDAQPPPAARPEISRPTGPVLDTLADTDGAVRQAVRYGAGATLVAAVVVAGMSLISSGASRVWAAMIGMLVLVAVVVWLARRLTEPIGAAIWRVRRSSRAAAVGFAVMCLGPVLLLGYTVTGGPAPLVAAMVSAVAGQLLVLVRR
ncbi:tetratricopeptide repeat protein [Mangrovihabitans endophyticus]|uniref:Tetratricopeptide repeat-containing protein n=1 Tax=Mangrovihabitans endophyticus TaxID=1751298 RepID=A0A8J3C1V0_9ACTN|nr:tetratricopeptide repeat protein [Mangrovihabitans endophyticus]GGL02951.1 hypothetical protein GCM10012284_41970 [Mangrovihabitans endophyticus]